MKTPINENIKRFRIANKMTQETLAQKLYVSRQTISSYESGRTTPDIEMLGKIADMLNVSYMDIVSGTNDSDNKYLYVKRIAVTLAALLLLFGLLQSATLWGINIFLQVEPGPIDDANRELIDLRFSILSWIYTFSNIGIFLSGLSCLFLIALPFFNIKQLKSSDKIKFVFAVTCLLFAVVLPWSFLDPLYTFSVLNHLAYPLGHALLSAIATVISIVIEKIKFIIENKNVAKK